MSQYTKGELKTTEIMQEKSYTWLEARAYIQGVKDSATQEMYEACKFAEYMIRNETWDFKPERDKALELLSEALIKAER